MKDDRLYLSHIRDAIHRILSYTKDGKAAFLTDPKSQDATIRNMEIVGEAVKRLSDQTRSRRPEIPWKRIAGMRDKMIHEYFGVDHRLVWDVVEQQLPDLLRAIESLLAEKPARRGG